MRSKITFELVEEIIAIIFCMALLLFALVALFTMFICLINGEFLRAIGALIVNILTGTMIKSTIKLYNRLD